MVVPSKQILPHSAATLQFEANADDEDDHAVCAGVCAGRYAVFATHRGRR